MRRSENGPVHRSRCKAAWFSHWDASTAEIEFRKRKSNKKFYSMKLLSGTTVLKNNSDHPTPECASIATTMEGKIPPSLTKRTFDEADGASDPARKRRKRSKRAEVQELEKEPIEASSAGKPIKNGIERTENEEQKKRKRRRNHGSQSASYADRASDPVAAEKAGQLEENSSKEELENLDNNVGEQAAVIEEASSNIGKSTRRSRKRSKNSEVAAAGNNEPMTDAINQQAQDAGDLRAAGPKSKHARRAKKRQLRASAAAGIRDLAETKLVVTDSNKQAGQDVDGSTKTNTKRSRQKRRPTQAKHRSTAGANVPQQGRDGDQLVLKSSQRDRNAARWNLSLPSAGRFLECDPIFVQNGEGEEFVIAASERQMQLLSLTTSLLVHASPVTVGKKILSYNLDPRHTHAVMLVHSDGSTSWWDWTSNELSACTFAVRGAVAAIASTASADATKTLVFYVSRVSGESAIFDQKRKFYSTKQPLSNIRVLNHGNYVVACGPRVLVLGARESDNASASEFGWIEVPLTSTTICFDVRISQISSSGQKKGARPSLSIALGNTDGQIHLYDNVTQLFRTDRQQTLPVPRILHWHREAVSSVKFSADGNYLISGGKETVLVLWQLETGKKQFLPHLTSEIERVVVNPKGDRYAVQMGDNAIVVLSTSELKPVAHFAGLQVASHREGRVEAPMSTAVLHPTQPHLLLQTVPSSRPKSIQDTRTRAFLQTFDIRASRHITRQALTRNNVTDFNLGPERTPILPPDVRLIAISQDGKSLATVDEWTPPAVDLEHVGLLPEQRREETLKMWAWDEESGLWTLTTRVDNPHGSAGRISGLDSDPSTQRFVTVGEDSRIKVWKSKAVRGHIEWTCRLDVQLPSDRSPADSSLGGRPLPRASPASLAFSGDGSILAVAQNVSLDPDEMSTVHFIDASSGAIRSSSSGLANGEITSMAFLERYLLVVAKPATYVWDLVKEELLYKIKLESLRSNPLLAVNVNDGTFALVASKHSLEVHGTKESKCLYRETFDTPIEAIVAGKGTRGYTLLFADATIRTLSPSVLSRALFDFTEESASLAGEAVGAVSEMQSAPDSTDISEAEGSANIRDLLAPSEERSSRITAHPDIDDRPVVRPQQLSNIFDISAQCPPVKDMFRAVVDLFGRRPMQVVKAVA